MSTRKPPALAVWIQKRVGFADESLAGDLVEEFRNGRSPGWYWRQTLTAALVIVARRIRVFPVDLQAVFIGFGAQAAILATLVLLHVPLQLRSVGYGILAFVSIVLSVAMESHLRLDKLKEHEVRPYVTLRIMSLAWFIAPCIGDTILVVLGDRSYGLLIWLHLVWVAQAMMTVLIPKPKRKTVR